MKKLEIQTNFTAGELSPRLYAFVNASKYASAVKKAQNFRVLPQGPAIRRNGSQYIADTKTDSAKSRLIRFQFDQTNAYILEFGNQYIRFYRNGGQVVSGGSPYEISTPYTASEIFQITYVQFGNTLYLAHFNHPPQQLVWSGDTSWVLSPIQFYPPATYESGIYPNTTLTPAATSGTSVTFTAGASGTFIAADAGRQIHSIVDGGIASITSVTDSQHVVCTIINNFSSTSAISANNWYMDLSPIANLVPSGIKSGSTITFNAINSVGGHNKPGGTLTPGATSGSSVTFTAANSVFNSGMVGDILNNLANQGQATITAYTNATTVTGNVTTTWSDTNPLAANAWEIQTPITTFRSTDVGNYIVIDNGVAQITAYISGSQVSANLQKGLSGLTETETWQMETPVWNATNGYPRVVALHQQRLVFASTTLKPQSIWMSESGLFTNMGTGSNDADAIEIDIATNQINQVQWAIGLRGDLLIGTTGSELSIGTGSVDGVITPSTISQSTRSYNGSLLQTPIAVANEILYVQKSGRKVEAMRFNFAIDNYESEDLTFLAEHITSSGIVEIAYANDPDRTIYAVLNDGTMAVGTYYKEQQVIGWTKWVTNGSYESVQTISTGTYYETWVIVNRTVNGSTKRYIERFDYTDLTAGQDSSTAYSNLSGFSDCYLTYSKPITVTGITEANPGVITAPSHGLSNGDNVKFFGLGDMTQLIGVTYIVANVTTNTFTLTDTSGNAINTTNFTTYTSGGNVYKLVTTISNLSQLEGMTVQVLADGAVQANKTVSGGSITLDSPSYQVVVGLAYTAQIETLNKEYNLGLGTQQGQQVRWVRPIVRLYNSALPTLNGEFLPARNPTMLMNNSVGLYSGDAVYHGLTWDATGILTLEMDLPFPCMILGIFGSLDGGSQ